MYKAFAIAGYGPEVLEAKFGGMLKALQYGAPPHGGIAPGIDRIVMLLAGASNLRDVIMFPMNQQAQDLLMGAPPRSRRSSCASCISGWPCRRGEPETSLTCKVDGPGRRSRTPEVETSPPGCVPRPGRAL